MSYKQQPVSLKTSQLARRLATLLLTIVGAITLLSVSAAAGRVKYPTWVEDAIAQSASYAPDKDAPAVSLWQWATVTIKKDGKSQWRVQQAVKVLNQVGVEETYFHETVSKRRKVKKLKGWRIEPSGTAHEMEKSNVVQAAIGNAAGYYDDNHSLVAGLNDVRTGDVVAYEYEITEDAGPEGFLKMYIFQVDIPVLTAHFEVTIPEGWAMIAAEDGLEDAVYSADGDRIEWTLTNLPYQPWEPLMPPWAYVRRSVQLSCYDPSGESERDFDCWNAVAVWANERHAEKAVPGEEVRARAMALTEHAANPWERFLAIADYAQHDIRYVAVELGEGRFEPRHCDATFANAYGDCKDKTTLMRALLTAVGIDSRPVLACMDAPVDKDLPSPFQFNHEIIAVPADIAPEGADASHAVVDGWLYFDPTDESTPPGYLSGSLTGSYVLHISADDSALVRLPFADNSMRRRLYRANAVLGGDHSITADIRVLDYGMRAHRMAHRRTQRSTEDALSEWRTYFADIVTHPNITNMTMQYDTDSAWIDLHLSAPGYLDLSGNLGILKADLFHSDGTRQKLKNPRHHPLWFGSPGRWETDITWTFPPNWRLEEIPGSDSISCETVTLITDGIRTDSGVRFKTKADYSGAIEYLDTYDDARAVYRAMRSAYETRYVLTKQEGK